MNQEYNVGQPPTIPPTISISPPRRRQTTQSEVSDNNFYKRFQDARSVAVSILEGTEWSRRSRTAAQDLLQAIERSPNIQDFSKDAEDLPEELREAVEKFISVLREVNIKLDKVASKYGTRKRGMRERIKYFLAMLREGRCGQILQTCQDDVDLAAKAIHENLGDGANEALGSSIGAHLARQTEFPVEGSIAGDHSKSTKDSSEGRLPSSGQELIVSSGEVHSMGGLGVPPSGQVHSTAGLGVSGGTSGDLDNYREDPKEPIEPAGSPPSSTPIASQSSKPGAIADHRQVVAPGLAQSSNVPEAQSKSSRRQDCLNVASKVFTSVEAFSGMIPIVGSYVGAAAKVGLTCVEMVQGMDSNDEAAGRLQARTSRLSDILEQFKHQPFEPERDKTAQLVSNLKRQVGSFTLWDRNDVLRGSFRKLSSYSENAGQLQDWEARIQQTLNETQLLLNLEIADRVTELAIAEVQRERRELLASLGNANYGARDDKIENIICHPETRVDILARINEWASQGKDSPPLLWLKGMAGRGKSAIASTVAHGWRERKVSCALFHFRRGQTALSNRLICALARQLIRDGTTEVREAVLQAVRLDRDVAAKTLEEQFKTLLVEPLQKLEPNSPPVLLVVDALDECEDTKYAVRFIDAVAHHASSVRANIKFLVTSRPEDPLVRALHNQAWQEEDLDNISGTTEDIARFLNSGLARIRMDHHLPEDWPSQEAVNSLAAFSQGLFQWAHTAINYIGESMPKRRLRDLVKAPTGWVGLDDLYHQILSGAFDRLKTADGEDQLMCRVLGIIVVAYYPVSLEVIAYLCADHKLFAADNQEEVIELLRGQILAGLTSMVSMPTSSSDYIQFMHTSIRDFLIDDQRCAQKPYFIDMLHNHQSIALQCMQLMERGLKKNICNLTDLSKPNSDPEVQRRVQHLVPKGLQYCCRSWPMHLIASVQPIPDSATMISVMSIFKYFSKEQLLFWLEVMSLIEATGEAFTFAKEVHTWLKGPKCEADAWLIEIWNDLHCFIGAFLEPILFGALHIYMSALPVCPIDTKICEYYSDQKMNTMRFGHQRSGWSAALWIRAVSSRVGPVAFSPDGKTLASGSDDGTIQLWNVEGGSPIGEPVRGHSNSVTSVAFSLDGKTFASGSKDCTIRLWNVEAGSPIGEPLRGHHNTVRSVAFSPDGKTLASGSYDDTIQLWNVEAGSQIGERLRGHGGVRSVAFSPDGKTLASGSDNCTIRLWNVEARSPFGEPLGGHSFSVKSLAFSPYGKTLASGSYDGAIRLWNVETGSPIGQPLRGHSDPVASVAFSQDGKTLASGYDDGTIQLWNAEAGSPIGEPLRGHVYYVRSLAFSPDGKTLASGSDDCTIQLWNVEAGSRIGEPLREHSNGVKSVAFSLDGKTFASGSDDCTIQLWNAEAGSPIGESLRGHRDWVTSVAFSPDGKTLASGSNDRTIRLWNVEAGSPIGPPLRKHRDWVTSVAFSPAGVLISEDMSGGQCYWDLISYLRLAPSDVAITPSDSFEFRPIPLKIKKRWLLFDDSKLLWVPSDYFHSNADSQAFLVNHLVILASSSVTWFDVSQVLSLEPFSSHAP